MRKLRNGKIRFTHWTCTDFNTPGRKDDLYNHTSKDTALRAWKKLTNIYYKLYGYRVWIEDEYGRIIKTTEPEGQPMRFSELAIGDRFRFASEQTMPNSGMATGPWRKISARLYNHESNKVLTRVKVGSINVDVIKLAPKPAYQMIDDYAAYLANLAHVAYTVLITPHLFLVGKLGADKCYEIVDLVREHPEGYTRLISEPVPRSLARDALTRWFAERLQRQPILAVIERHFADGLAAPIAARESLSVR